MPSPFPGMDPYLEDPAFWPDFHHRFIDCWCEAIADVLPDHYDASIGEQVYLTDDDFPKRQTRIPDVSVTRETGVPRSKAPATGGVATLEPVAIPLLLPEGIPQTYIEILRRPDMEVVAVVELLSPTNKAGKGLFLYRTKRHELILQGIHLVELDLLLGGERIALERPLPPGDCHYLLTRADDRPDCDVYSWFLRDPLPTLPIPLREPDPDILIDLGKVFAVAYERGRYRKRLRYRKPLPAPLSPEDEAWAKQLLGPLSDSA